MTYEEQQAETGATESYPVPSRQWQRAPTFVRLLLDSLCKVQKIERLAKQAGESE
jgi:hypothetical protein